MVDVHRQHSLKEETHKTKDTSQGIQKKMADGFSALSKTENINTSTEFGNKTFQEGYSRAFTDCLNFKH